METAIIWLGLAVSAAALISFRIYAYFVERDIHRLERENKALRRELAIKNKKLKSKESKHDETVTLVLKKEGSDFPSVTDCSNIDFLSKF